MSKRSRSESYNVAQKTCMLLRTVCQTEKDPETCKLFCANQCHDTLDGIIEELSEKTATMNLIDCKNTLDVATGSMIRNSANPLAVREASANVTRIMFEDMYERADTVVRELKKLCSNRKERLRSSTARRIGELTRKFEKIVNTSDDIEVGGEDFQQLADLYLELHITRDSCKYLDLTPNMIDRLEAKRRERRLETPNTKRRGKSRANQHYGTHVPTPTEIKAMEQEQLSREIIDIMESE